LLPLRHDGTSLVAVDMKNQKWRDFVPTT